MTSYPLPPLMSYRHFLFFILIFCYILNHTEIRRKNLNKRKWGGKGSLIFKLNQIATSSTCDCNTVPSLEKNQHFRYGTIV